MNKKNYRRFVSGTLLFSSFFLLALILIPGVLNSSPTSGRSQKSAPGTDSTAAQAVNPAARQALTGLQSANQAQIVTQISRQTGNYSFVRAPGGSLLAADKISAPPKTRALAFLATNGALVGISDAERTALSKGSGPAEGSDLRIVKSNTDSIGMTHVKLNQFYKGLQVFGAQLVVHMNGKGITAVNGNYVPEISLSTVPALTKAVAGENAVTILRKGGDNHLKVNKAELGIYPMGLLEGTPVVSRLAYAVEVSGAKLHEQVWIDAQTGVVLNRIPLRHTALNRIIYTPEYDNDGPFAVRHEGDPFTPGAPPGTTGADPINNLYLFAGHTYNMFRSAFGRDSYDGLGHTMHSVLLVNEACPNAYWNGISTNYCPDFDADDVVSHEWGHAYTQFTHNLIYSYQSGALNESYSDIFGETADLLNGVDAEGGANNTDTMDEGGQRWQIGEDVNVLNQPALGILRDMWDPTTFGQPDTTQSPNYSCGAADGGGVHANSGVPNHAYAMLVDGKTFNGQTVAGIGFIRALAIYYRAMTVYQGPTTDFAAHADALDAACADLIGEQLKVISTSSATGVVSPNVVTASTCQQVTKAMLAVEMSEPVPCPIVILLNPDEPPACNGATNIFAENWETGMDGWTRTSTGVTADWTMNDANPPGNDQARLRNFNVTSSIPGGGGSGSAIHGANPAIGEDGGGTCAPGGDYSGQYTIETTNPITIPAGASDLEMRFDHWVATETGFDGAQVEISVNGGAFALVPAGNYLFNPPNANLTSVVDGNTNPNAGEAAWTGTNIGTPSNQPPGSWGTTIIDLRSLTNPGNTIKVRFTFSQDGCNGVDGWYVDNIRIYFCPVLPAPVLSLGADYEDPDTNGSYTLNWTRPPGATGPDVLQVSTASCVPLLFDDAENGLGQWTATTTGPDPNLAWQSVGDGDVDDKPAHDGTTFRARGTNGVVFANSAAILTFNSSLAIPTTGQTFLTFSDWDVNEGEDTVFVEASTNNGTTWTPIYQNVRSAQVNDGAVAFATEPLFQRSINLANYGGQTIKLRFRYQTGPEDRPASVPLGWYIDDILIANDSWTGVTTTSGTSRLISGKPAGNYCYRVRSAYNIGGQLVPSPFSNVVNVVVAQGPLPSAAVSRKSHGGFQGNIPLPLTGNPGIECRNGGAPNNHQMVITFPSSVTVGDAEVTSGTGSVVNFTPSGTVITVNLTGVTNIQTIVVTLFSVNNAGNVSIPMSVLLADTTGNRTVNASDVSQTKSRSGQAVGASNFRSDVAVSGSINSSDISMVKSKSGTALP